MLIDIAKIGKTVGLRGYLRLNLLTDFPEQFKKGITYHTKTGNLTIEDINSKFEVKFKGCDTKEEAQKLTNLVLQLPKEEAQKLCKLKQDEYFWYDITGLDVYEDGKKIGTIKDIQRLPTKDHIVIKLEKQNSLKRLIFPFDKKSIGKVDIKDNKIEVFGALEMISVLTD